MGSSQNLVFPITNRHRIILISLLLFFFLFQQHLIFAQARQISDPPKGRQEEEEVVVVVERELIGSRPPRCEGRCRNCGHCEAIQVPIVPQQGYPRNHFVRSSSRTTRTNPVIAYSRGDALSNYKPMSWKCKCGDTIFNP